MDVGGDRLGGLGKIVGYNSQPELINGKMVKSAMDEKMCGGGKVNSLRSDNTPRNQRRQRNQRRNKKSSGKIFYKKVGGSYESSFIGKDSVYTDNMNKREFGCRQSNWDPKCI